MKVENMTSSRSGREVANQFIIRDDTRIVFQSYDSTIAIIDNSKEGAAKLTLGRDWDYNYYEILVSVLISVFRLECKQEGY